MFFLINNPYSNKNQETTLQLYCTTNGGSCNVCCYLRWMLSLWILWAVCLIHLPGLSLVPWCAGSTDKRRCETLSAQGNLWRMKLQLFLSQPGAHGEDDEREVVKGTNGSQLYLDPLLSEGTWVWRGLELRWYGIFKVRSISLNLIHFDHFFLVRAESLWNVSRFVSLPPDGPVFCKCLVYFLTARARMPALCPVLHSDWTYFCSFFPLSFLAKLWLLTLGWRPFLSLFPSFTFLCPNVILINLSMSPGYRAR